MNFSYWLPFFISVNFSSFFFFIPKSEGNSSVLSVSPRCQMKEVKVRKFWNFVFNTCFFLEFLNNRIWKGHFRVIISFRSRNAIHKIIRFHNDLKFYQLFFQQHYLINKFGLSFLFNIFLFSANKKLKSIVRDLPKNWISGKVGIEFSCFLLDLKHFKSLFMKKILCKYLISQFLKECSWSFIHKENSLLLQVFDFFFWISSLQIKGHNVLKISDFIIFYYFKPF